VGNHAPSMTVKAQKGRKRPWWYKIKGPRRGHAGLRAHRQRRRDRREGRLQRLPPQSSSASRVTAGAAGKQDPKLLFDEEAIRVREAPRASTTPSAIAGRPICHDAAQ